MDTSIFGHKIMIENDNKSWFYVRKKKMLFLRVHIYPKKQAQKNEKLNVIHFKLFSFITTNKELINIKILNELKRKTNIFLNKINICIAGGWKIKFCYQTGKKKAEYEPNWLCLAWGAMVSKK
jgi:hypothetical protein